MPNKVVHKIATNVDADTLAAGSAIGFGLKLASDVEVIVSIVAGVLVAGSAGLSIWLNLREYRRQKREEKEQSESE